MNQKLKKKQKIEIRVHIFKERIEQLWTLVMAGVEIVVYASVTIPFPRQYSKHVSSHSASATWRFISTLSHTSVR